MQSWQFSFIILFYASCVGRSGTDGFPLSNMCVSKFQHRDKILNDSMAKTKIKGQ